MYSQAILVSLLAAVAQARFGREQEPIPAISAVQGGDPGEAPTIAGAAISDLLAAANPCNKLKRGDQILAELGTGADSIAAAKGMVQAEQNVNPFAFSNPAICTDPSLPANPILRGIIPLIDPAFDGADAVNTLSADTLANPLNADGKSIADLLTENGFTNFRGIASDGSGPAVSGTPASQTTAADAAPAPAASNVDDAAQSAPAAAQPTSAVTGGDIDFGLCVPTMDFVAGRPGRAADEFTFLPTDELTKQGQQEALNPNIITNRICDQLTNVCQSNQAAKDRCRDCQSQIQALGTRDQTTADAWNDCVLNGVDAAPDTAAPVANDNAAAPTAVADDTAAAPAPVNTGAASGADDNNNAPSTGNTGSDVQTFTGSVGAPPVPVENVGGARPFVVNGDSFVNFAAACQRACDVQKNQCANAANGGNRAVKVSDCETQQQDCTDNCQSTVAKRESRFIRVYRRA
ncbi:hypothetical protein Dda_1630 [Drechslerella dactyloides]|uniref:Uncharacterized protein n=1 Tax=Drechslerella dactyloides TaxID=74499 RepID=A0AAD6J6F6_DREDA|nr:hypothetical protein Dda_1630 [Drechslerella dactyloides]